jgi:molecular chaperone GrpE
MNQESTTAEATVNEPGLPVDLGPEEHSVTEDPAPAHTGSDAPALEAELAEWKDKYARLMAEFDNFRKRTAREKELLLRFGAEPIAAALLPAIDDLERSVQATKLAADNPASLPLVIEGLDMVQRKFLQALEQQSIRPIEAVGKAFDSHEHEAIASLPTDDASKKGIVIEQVERGYRYHDRIIRYAKVITGE